MILKVTMRTPLIIINIILTCKKRKL